jgi:hypothetical protein
MRNSGCGYDSCPCRGVHFISGNGVDADYCVDGKRVRLSAGSLVLTPSATEQQVFKLEMHLLDDYARYLRWRGEQPWRREVPVSPFNHSLPLKHVGVD